MQKSIVQYVGQPRFLPSKNIPTIAQFEKVIGHPTLGDSQNVTTSRIVSIDGQTIETKNTIYIPAESVGIN